MADAQTPGAQAPESPQQENGGKEKKPVYKKAWFWILIVVIVLILFVSCSSSGDTDTESTTTDTGSTAVEQTEEVTTEDETSEEDAVEEETTEEETTEEEDDGEFEETVLYDENGITITATGIEGGFGGVYLDLSVTNESSETVTIYNNDDFSIGDTMTSTWFYTTVASGKTAEEQMEFYDLSSKDELTDFSGTFTIYNEETYDTIDEPEISMSLS